MQPLFENLPNRAVSDNCKTDKTTIDSSWIHIWPSIAEQESGYMTKLISNVFCERRATA